MACGWASGAAAGVVSTVGVAPPEPDLRAATAPSEKALDALAPGDARRLQLLVDLTVRRHADALDAAAQEDRERRTATEGPGTSAIELPVPRSATPQADALRAEAVSFALRAAEEGPDAPEVPDALIAGALDAERIGRAADAGRLLGLLIRRHAESRHAGDAWAALAERHVRAGDLTRARAALSEAERRGRPTVRAWAAARAAEVSLAAGDVTTAIAAAERALDAGASRAREVAERVAKGAAGDGGVPEAVRRRAAALPDRAKPGS